MFDISELVVKVAVVTDVIPITVVSGVVIHDRVLNNKDKPYTAETVSNLVENLTNAAKPKR